MTTLIFIAKVKFAYFDKRIILNYAHWAYHKIIFTNNLKKPFAFFSKWSYQQ